MATPTTPLFDVIFKTMTDLGLGPSWKVTRAADAVSTSVSAGAQKLVDENDRMEAAIKGVWRWVVNANDGLGSDVDDLVTLLNNAKLNHLAPDTD